MEYYILDNDFNIVTGVEKFQSMIWTEKFYDVGDFELYLPASDESLAFYNDAAKNHYYIIAAETTNKETIRDLSAMRIEKVKLEDTYESGDFLIITGHQLKNILSTRIVWNRKTIAGPLWSELMDLVSENAIRTSLTGRDIPRLALETPEFIDPENPTLEEEVLLANVNYAVEGEILSKALSTICKDQKIGWDVKVDFVTKTMKFVILQGKDRTSSQSRNTRVIFSSSFDNLLKTTYQIDNTNFKNVALVKGSYEEYNIDTKVKEVVRADQVVTPYNLGYNPAGLNRYELYVEGENATLDNESTMVNVNALAYNNQSKGRTELEKYKSTVSVSADVAPGITYKLNKDYFLGDVCSIRNEYNLIYDGRVTSITRTLSTSKSSIIPSFTIENYPGKEQEDERDKEEDRRETEDGSLRENEAGVIRIRTYLKYKPSFVESGEERETEDGQRREVTVGYYDEDKLKVK